MAGTVSAALVRNSAAVAAAACIPLSLRNGRRAAVIHLSAVGAGLVYNAKLKHTALSVAPYVVAFGALPAFVALSSDTPRRAPAHTMIAAALLGAGAHFINVLPDVEADAVTAIRGLPQRLGPTRALAIGAGLLASSTIVVATFAGRPTTLLQRTLAATSVTAVTAVVGSSRAGHQRSAWWLSLLAAASMVMLHVTQSFAGDGTSR
ncbi:MAG: prenyltransferase [Ilumatobacteraceae bacterium]|nr:prenyltransferase [Ilumatobacteraceae bacterium]